LSHGLVPSFVASLLPSLWAKAGHCQGKINDKDQKLVGQDEVGVHGGQQGSLASGWLHGPENNLLVWHANLLYVFPY
jgi:hypothetical protein